MKPILSEQQDLGFTQSTEGSSPNASNDGRDEIDVLNESEDYHVSRMSKE